MESPGTADTKTSRASVSSPASAAALNGRLLWAWKLQEEQWEGKTSECSLPPPWQARTPAFIHLLHEKDPRTGLPSCSFSVVPTFFIFLGDFMKSGKMVLRPRMSTNLWQLSVPSGPIMAWSSTFRALLREIFFSLWRESCNLNFSGTEGALNYTTSKTQHEKGNWSDEGSHKEPECKLQARFSSRSQNIILTNTLFKTVVEDKLLALLFLIIFISFYFPFYYLYMCFYFSVIKEVLISSPPYKH